MNEACFDRAEEPMRDRETDNDRYPNRTRESPEHTRLIAIQRRMSIQDTPTDDDREKTDVQ